MSDTFEGHLPLAVLHDATLHTLEVRWAEGRAVLRLRATHLGEVTLCCAQMLFLEVPRAQPWGPSVSVNSVEWRTEAEVGGVLEIELQSGDLIRVFCESWALERCDLNPPPGAPGPP